MHAHPWKCWKVIDYKISISEVLFERPRHDRFRLFHFCICYKRTVCCCTCILKENEGRRTRPQIWYWEANAIIVPRFYHIHRRSGTKIVSASGQVKIVQKSICAGSPEELTAFHQTLLEGRGLAASSPRTPPRLGPSGLGSSLILQCPPLEKNPVGAHDYTHDKNT